MTGPGSADGAAQEWKPSVAHGEDAVDEVAARALHDLLSRDGEPPVAGSPLPLLWHWLAFLPQVRHRDLGEDGHPRTGTFLPPTPGRTRMYGGGRLTREGTLRVGQRIARRSTVTRVTRKRGRSGELLLVRVDHSVVPVDGEAGVGIHEEQDLLYRHPQATDSPAPPVPGSASGRTAVYDAFSWGRDVPVEPVLLFRFSALTYNAHRIHYDRDYATTREGYPGLVVHGPLQAVLLADTIERAYPHHLISSFSFRATAPAFDDHPLRLRLTTGEGEDGTTRITAAVHSGPRQTMSATATLIREAPVGVAGPQHGLSDQQTHQTQTTPQKGQPHNV